MATPTLPPGGRVPLPGRGAPWVWDTGGPPGAPTVVLLHGWTSTAALNWRPAFAPLSDEFRVVALDHRGHGRGIKSVRPFRLEDCADDVAALVRTLRIDPVVAVGYSMGGPVAQLLWRRHPDLVSGLVLCATAARFARPSGWGAAINLFGLGLSAALMPVPPALTRQLRSRSMMSAAGADPASVRWVLEEQHDTDVASVIQAGVALNGYDATGWIGRVDVPTSVLVTEADVTVAPSRQRRMAAAIPNARTFSVDGAHRACVDNLDAFIPILLSACRHSAGIDDGKPDERTDADDGTDARTRDRSHRDRSHRPESTARPCDSSTRTESTGRTPGRSGTTHNMDAPATP